MKSLALCGPDPRPITKTEAIGLAEVCHLLPHSPAIVQIGAYWGVSTAVLLETRPDAYIFSIDINPCEQERKTLIELGLDYRRVVRLLGKSAEIGTYWPYSVDMLFIDGDHTYKGLKADCAAWLRHVKGFVVFHDYIPNCDKVHNQVAEVVDELFKGQEAIVKTGSLIGFEV